MKRAAMLLSPYIAVSLANDFKFAAIVVILSTAALLWCGLRVRDEKMLSKQISPYESCKEITEKIREQKKRVADIKSEIEKVDWSDRGTLNDQMSGALRRLEELKQDLVKEISPGVMYSRIGEEKFTVNLSEELIDFVSPDNKDDLLSETSFR